MSACCLISLLMSFHEVIWSWGNLGEEDLRDHTPQGWEARSKRAGPWTTCAPATIAASCASLYLSIDLMTGRLRRRFFDQEDAERKLPVKAFGWQCRNGYPAVDEFPDGL